MALNINNTALKACNINYNGTDYACKKITVNGTTVVWVAEHDLMAEWASKWKYVNARYYNYPGEPIDANHTKHVGEITSQTATKLSLKCQAMGGMGSGTINAYIGPIDVTDFDRLVVTCSARTANSSSIDDEGVHARFCLRNSIPTAAQLATERESQEAEDGTSLTYGSYVNDNSAFLKGITNGVKNITGSGTFELNCSSFTGNKYLLVQLSSTYNGDVSEPTATMTLTSIKLSN